MRCFTRARAAAGQVKAVAQQGQIPRRDAKFSTRHNLRQGPEQCGDELVVPLSSTTMTDVEESSLHVASKAKKPSPETLTSAWLVQNYPFLRTLTSSPLSELACTQCRAREEASSSHSQAPPCRSGPGTADGTYQSLHLAASNPGL